MREQNLDYKVVEDGNTSLVVVQVYQPIIGDKERVNP